MEQRKAEDRDRFSVFGRARNEMRTCAIARSLTLVPRSFLLNRMETLATQATQQTELIQGRVWKVARL